VLRELEEEDAEAADAPAAGAPAPLAAVPAPPSTRAPLWRRPSRWASLASGLAALGIAGLWLSRGLIATPGDPLAVADQVEQSGHGLPPGWRSVDLVSGPRGKGSDASSAAKAAHAGALLVDVALAARAGDSAAVREYAQDARGLEEIPVGSPVVRIVNAPAAPAESIAALVGQAAERFGKRLGWPELRLGAWTEGARIAAHRHDAAYFRSSRARTALKSAADLVHGDATALAAVERVRAVSQSEPVDWNALSAALDALLKELTTARP